MSRPSRVSEKRREILPALADAFTELGYRRATTQSLARRCGIQENVLYRLWPDKKAMFIAAIEHVYDFSETTWLRLLETAPADGGGARRLLEFESIHHGEFGHYRIIFTGLGETDDPEIRKALKSMFTRFHRFLLAQLVSQPKRGRSGAGIPPALAAWAFIGLGTVANIGRELGALGDSDRKRLIATVGQFLLGSGDQ